MTTPSFAPIVDYATMYWTSSALLAGIENRIFTHLDSGAQTIGQLAERAHMRPRGARALLDALAGMGFVSVADGKYTNSPTAAEYLVEGKKTFMGDYVRLAVGHMPSWKEMPSALRSGHTLFNVKDVPDHDYWPRLVHAIGPISTPVAQLVCETLGIATAGPLSILDVGGGMGVFSAVFLGANPEANAVQVDWARANRVAETYLREQGLESRFRVIDGDLLGVDYGKEIYDIVVYSHIAHGFSAEENLQVLKKFHTAMKPDGTLVINEYLIRDDGTGHPFALRFGLNILFHSPGGENWREGEYRDWLKQAGFRDVRLQTLDAPVALFYAKR